MNKYGILHIPDSRYCFPTGDKELVIRLRMAIEDEAAEVFLVCGCKYDFSFDREKKKLDVKYRDKLYNYYEIKLTLWDLRFAYIFQIQENGKTYYYSEDGITTSYNFDEGFYNFFQMPYINKNDLFPVVEWMRNAVFYQIFVERFNIGNKQKDTSYINMKWDDEPTPFSFAGGDLEGIIQKLDYIKNLGMNAIYLTPVFQSVSNHKYDIINYMEIDEHFGSMETLKELVEKAHHRGIRVVLDAVFNHSSMYMSQFQDVLKKGKESEYYDWFMINGDYPDMDQLNYECFATCNYMPKLNTSNQQVQDFLIEIGIYWIKECDIDGWRLDVSDEVSHEFWRLFRKAVKNQKNDAVIIGENWHDAYSYLKGEQYDSIMNYAFTKACLDYFAKGRFNAKEMAEKLNSNLMRNMEQANRMMLNLLDSHDTHRFYTESGKNKDRLLAAIALEMIFIGAPCIYYGTEILLEGGYDPDSRRCFQWNEDEWDIEFMSKFKNLTKIRSQNTVMYGDIAVWNEKGMLAVSRAYGSEKMVLLINLTAESVTVDVPMDIILSENKTEKNKIKTDGFMIVMNPNLEGGDCV